MQQYLMLILNYFIYVMGCAATCCSLKSAQVSLVLTVETEFHLQQKSGPKVLTVVHKARKKNTFAIKLKVITISGLYHVPVIAT